MTDAQLKELISRTRQPAKYEVGDVVRIREPEAVENNESWGSYKSDLGRVGRIEKAGHNTYGGTVRVQYINSRHNETRLVRSHWVEPVFKGEAGYPE